MKYIRCSPWWIWLIVLRRAEPLVGIFRNKPGIVPGRWGVRIIGLEIGSRNPRDPVGVWLVKHKLWRW